MIPTLTGLSVINESKEKHPDLTNGPHLPSTGKLLHALGSRGQSSNPWGTQGFSLAYSNGFYVGNTCNRIVLIAGLSGFQQLFNER
jgi:hypothetical protein